MKSLPWAWQLPESIKGRNTHEYNSLLLDVPLFFGAGVSGRQEDSLTLQCFYIV